MRLPIGIPLLVRNINIVGPKGVEVICHDIPELAGIRGLLGLSFLRHFRTVIDYQQGYLEIS